MSTAPEFPPDYREPEQPPRAPRHSRWKRVLAWVAGIIVVIIILVVIAVYVLLHTSAGRQYVLNAAQQRLSAALGSQVHARDFNVSFSGVSPTLDLYNAVVDGAAPYATPSLLKVDRIHVALKITSLVNRTWYLNDITLDHPVVRVFVDAHGTDNLPKSSSSGQSNTNIFDLGVRHAQINRGEIYFNDRKSSLEANLNNLTLKSVFHPAQREYAGDLGYQNGELKYGAYAPLPHALQASFTATPAQFTLTRAVLTSGPTSIELTATLKDYSHPQLSAQYTAVLNTNEFRRIMHDASLPAGIIRMNGTMNYASQPDVPMMELLTANGVLTSPALRVSTSSFSGDIRDLRAQYEMAHGNFVARITNGQVLGGSVMGSLRVNDIPGVQKGSVNLTLHGASLAQLRSTANSSALSNYALSGTANLNVNGSWVGSPKNVQANVTADINAGVAGQATRGGNAATATTPPPPGSRGAPAVANAAPQGRIPVTGHLQLHYNGKTDQITVAPNSYIRTPQMQLSLNGALGKGSAMQVRFHSANLRELEALLPPATAASLQQMGVGGVASFTGTVRQGAAGFTLAGQLQASNLQLRGVTFPSFRTNLNYAPSGVTLSDGQLQMPNGGHLAFTVHAPLHNGNLVPGAPLEVNANGSRISVAMLAKALGMQVPVTGTLTIDVTLHGTELAPVGHGTIALANGSVEGQPVQSATLTFQANGIVVNGAAGVQLPGAGAARAQFTVNPRQQSYTGQVRAIGLQIGQLAAVKSRGMKVAGLLDITADGRGTFQNPELNANITAPQLTIENQRINQLSLQASLANHVATFAVNTAAVNTSLRAHGTVQLTGQYPADITLDTQPIPLGPIVAAYAPSQAGNLTGETELHATLRGPLKNKALLDAHAVVPVLRVDYKNKVQIAAAAPIHLDYTNGVLNLQRTTISGTDTNLQMQGSIPVTDRAKPMSLLLLGNINLQIAQLFNPDITSSGQLQFDINSYGQTTNPNFEGQVRIVNVNLATGSAPLGLQNGNGVLTLTRDRLDVTQFQATIGGGTVTAKGGLTYRPGLHFDVALAGHDVRMLYPDTVRETFNLNLALAGTPQDATLTGQVHLTNLSFTPDFDLMEFMGSFGTTTVAPPSQGFTSNLKLDLALQSSGGVSLVSRELTLQAGANLRVQGTADQPVVLGRVNLNGGDLIFQGNRYILQGGFVDFVNPYQTQPVVNVRIDTTIQQYNIHMMFRGPVDHMQTSYTSDPSLPPADIIHLVAFGQTTEAAAANPTPPGALGAESLVASQVSSQITSRISKIAGISQLSIDPVLQGSNQQNPGARVTIQQRVTGSIFVTFSTDVTSTQNQIIQLQYKVSPRLSVSGTRDQNGGFGFDARMKKTW